MAKAKDKRVLLHSCCAPCASQCLTRLAGIDVTAYFFNPNIMPYEEYRLRAENMQKLCRIFGIDYIEEGYDGSENGNAKFLETVRGMDEYPEGGLRCEKCFYLRLRTTALKAKTEGFDYFCTTLTLSPHKNADLINEIGFEIERETGVLYLSSDFKKRGGYQNSTQLCKKYGIYRQNYCGCLFKI